MIQGFVGRPGAGKTYLMSDLAVAAARRGTVVYSNYGLAGSLHFESWQQLIGLRSALVCVDEVGLWFSSRDWKSLPWEVSSWMAQSRKHGVDVFWTAQSWEQVDVALRRLTSYVYLCRCWAGYLMTAVSFDPWSKKATGHLWRLRNKSVCDAYDTFRLVGNRDGGQGGGRGAAAAAAVDHLSGCMVRRIDLGRVRWQQASVADLLAGEPLVRFERGHWAWVPDEVLEAWRGWYETGWMVDDRALGQGGRDTEESPFVQPVKQGRAKGGLARVFGR